MDQRLFSKSVVESDFFLDLPLSAQALYIHVCMDADDEGFCSSAKTVMRKIGANQNDYDLLVDKKFLIQFENGVVVVKHWRINNCGLRSHSTEYIELKKRLYLKPNGMYTLDKNDGKPVFEIDSEHKNGVEGKKRGRKKGNRKEGKRSEEKRNEGNRSYITDTDNERIDGRAQAHTQGNNDDELF